MLLLQAAFAQPSAPATPAVIPSSASGQVSLAWTAVAGASGYTIRRAPSLTGPFITLTSNHAATTFTDSSGTAGVFAYYVVSAGDAGGESPASPGVWAAPVIILDNAPPGGSAPGVTYTGTWATTGIEGSYGNTAVFASPTSTATYTFTPTLPAPGNYDVYVRWTAHENRATNTPIDLVSLDDSRRVTVNQRVDGGTWNLVSVVTAEAGSTSSVIIRNNGANGNVVADGVQFVPRFSPWAPDAERPDDYSVSVFQDHFDGATINPALWRQFLDRPHFSVSDGKLRLRLVWAGPVPLDQASPAEIASDANWNEGGIISQHSQKFGYHEARFRIPPASARGVDTAYWHLAADAVLNGYEIDAPEFFNKDAAGTNNNFGFGVWDHYPPTREIPGHLYGRTWDYTALNSTLASFAPVSGYITVGLEWRTDNTQVVYVNGRKVYEAPASGMNDVESVLPTNAILSTKILNWMNPAAGLDGAEAFWDYAAYYQKPGWLGSSSSVWSDPANWGPDGLPGPGRAAVFNVPPPSPSVTLPTDQSLASLSLDGATLPALTFSGPGALRLGASSDPTLTHGGILLNTAISANQTFDLPIVGVQNLQFANLSRTPGVTLRLNGLISGDGVAPRDIDFASSTAANVNLGPIVLGQPLGPGLRHVNRAGDGDFTLPAGSQHTGELRIARGTVILPDASSLGLDPTAAIVFKPNFKHSEPFRPRLRYLGPAATLARPVHISGWQADAVIESNGTGPLTLNGPFILQPSSPDPLKVLTRDLRLVLGALDSSGENTLASPLSDRDLVVSFNNRDNTLNTGPATLSLTKSGNGTWVLTGDNHLAEPVTVTGGRLVIGQGTSGNLTLRTSPRTGANPAINVQAGAEFVFGRDDDVAFSSRIQGAGSLRKQGAGTLTLGGNHSYTGNTTVQAGTLVLAGSITSAVTVDSGATVTGSGSSTAALTVRGTVLSSPLSIGGLLTIGSSGVLRADFSENSSAGLATLAAGAASFTSGARVNVVLNGPGSTANVIHTYWRTSRTFPLATFASRSGNLTLGTVSADSAGNDVSTYGSFSIVQTATAVNLVWTPVDGFPDVEDPAASFSSPASGVVNLPDTAHAVRLAASITGGVTTIVSWSKLSGPGVVTFGNSSSPDTTATFSANGTYVLRLTVSNALGTTTRDLAVNVAPAISFTFRQGSNGYAHDATFIRSDTPTWNSGARDQLLVGRNNGPFRTLLSFDLSALPRGATVLSASLDLWIAAAGNGTSLGTLDLHELLVAFSEGTGDGNSSTHGVGSGADWNNRSAGVPWATAGAAGTDFTATPVASLPGFNPTTTAAGTVLSYVSNSALTTAATNAVSAGRALAFVLRMNGDTSGSNAFVRIASDDHATAAQRPRLTVTLAPHIFTPTVDPGTAPSPSVNADANLNGTVENALSSNWSVVSGPGTVTFANASLPVTTARFSAPGSYVLRLAASNATGESSRTLQVTVLSVIESWRKTWFGTTANTGDAADLADPDGDGQTNIMEFAMGTSPKAPGASAMSVNASSGQLHLIFSRSTVSLASVSCTPEWSDTLAAGSWSDANVTTEILSDNGTTQQVRASVPVPASGTRFLRLRVVPLP